MKKETEAASSEAAKQFKKKKIERAGGEEWTKTPSRNARSGKDQEPTNGTSLEGWLGGTKEDERD